MHFDGTIILLYFIEMLPRTESIYSCWHNIFIQLSYDSLDNKYQMIAEQTSHESVA